MATVSEKKQTTITQIPFKFVIDTIELRQGENPTLPTCIIKSGIHYENNHKLINMISDELTKSIIENPKKIQTIFDEIEALKKNNLHWISSKIDEENETPLKIKIRDESHQFIKIKCETIITEVIKKLTITPNQLENAITIADESEKLKYFNPLSNFHEIADILKDAPDLRTDLLEIKKRKKINVDTLFSVLAIYLNRSKPNSKEALEFANLSGKEKPVTLRKIFLTNQIHRKRTRLLKVEKEFEIMWEKQKNKQTTNQRIV